MGHVRSTPRALGGAPLNFAAHAKRLGYNPLLISAVGDDCSGERSTAGNCRSRP